jgi:hypothetical protein
MLLVASLMFAGILVSLNHLLLLCKLLDAVFLLFLMEMERFLVKKKLNRHVTYFDCVFVYANFDIVAANMFYYKSGQNLISLKPKK